jgi:hypothetical protein
MCFPDFFGLQYWLNTAIFSPLLAQPLLSLPDGGAGAGRFNQFTPENL